MGRAADPAGGRRRLPGLRTAAVVYLVVVVLGLAGAASYAAWSQRGAVSASIAVETLKPASVDGSKVVCAARSSLVVLGPNQLKVTFPGSADATRHELTLTNPGNGATVSQQTEPNGGSGSKEAILNVDSSLLAVGETRTYALKIVPVYVNPGSGQISRGEPVNKTVTVKVGLGISIVLATISMSCN
jgi:predicted ribosomally synthesized peptide with SipW-like signal peptide